MWQRTRVDSLRFARILIARSCRSMFNPIPLHLSLVFTHSNRDICVCMSSADSRTGSQASWLWNSDASVQKLAAHIKTNELSSLRSLRCRCAAASFTRDYGRCSLCSHACMWAPKNRMTMDFVCPSLLRIHLTSSCTLKNQRRPEPSRSVCIYKFK